MHILVITGLTLPDVSEQDVKRIREAAGEDGTVAVARSAGEALEAASDVEVIMGALTPQLFAAAPKLRWVHAIASGVDAYLFPAMRESEVLLTGEKGLVGGHLADHAFALLLAITRGVAESARLGDRAWERRMEFRRGNLELSGMTMGIVGLGGTGREVARRAVAFGMRCRAVDAVAVDGTPECPRVDGMDAFHELLGGSDVVTICCPLTAETAGVFDAGAFEAMRRDAILINVTRGGIVDGDALAAALRERRIAAAGLDVTPEEPLPAGHPFWSLPNLVMTPHTAGASQLRAGRNIDRFCANLRRLRAGEPLEGVVDKRLGY